MHDSLLAFLLSCTMTVKIGDVDLFLIIGIVVAISFLMIIALYLLINYQHPDDKNDAYFPKAVVIFGFVLAGITVLMLPLDVANNEGFPGMYKFT
jgi:LMBR1 domain-containing protein 1